LAAVELGRLLGARQRAAGQTAADPGVGPLDGAVFGLFTLLLAFVFFGAAGRLERRRDLIVSATTAIEAAYRRVDFIPSDLQPRARTLFKSYIASLIALGEKPSVDAAMEQYRQITELEDQIWDLSVAAARREPGAGSLPSAVSDMISLTRTRFALANTHTPVPIFILLIALAFLSAMLAGRNMAGTLQPNRLNKLIFGVVVAVSIYTIVDLEFPRLGLIRIDMADQLLVRLLSTMS